MKCTNIDCIYGRKQKVGKCGVSILWVWVCGLNTDYVEFDFDGNCNIYDTREEDEDELE